MLKHAPPVARRRTDRRFAATAVAPVTLAHAQAVDASAIGRWTAAKVVHYRMVGVGTDGPAVIAYREPAGTATVTDRVEIELDWNLKPTPIVGEPRITNTAARSATCATHTRRARRRRRTAPTITWT